MPAEDWQAAVATFPLVGAGMSEAAALVATVRRLIIARSVPAVIPDIYQDDRIPRYAYRLTFARNLAMVPVRQEAPIAAMGAYWSSVKDVTPAEVELLQTVKVCM